MGSNPTPRTKEGPVAVVWHFKKLGRKDSTLIPMLRRLKYLSKNVDLNHPEKVKHFIASKYCSDGYKDNLIDAYSHYCKYYGIQWVKPRYMRVERITRVPREEDINKIISHAKPGTACKPPIST